MSRGGAKSKPQRVRGERRRCEIVCDDCEKVQLAGEATPEVRVYPRPRVAESVFRLDVHYATQCRCGSFSGVYAHPA